jgi:hypothetical protein
VLREDPFGSLVRAVSRRAWLTIAVVVVLALGGAALALRLEPSAGIDTLVDPSSESSQATSAAAEVFGDDAVIVLVEGPLENTLLTPDLGRLRDLEGCLAGNAPASDATLPDTCQRFAEERPAQVVYGPATFIGESANQLNSELESQISASEEEGEALAETARRAAAQQGASPAEQEQAAEAARSAVSQTFQAELAQRALQYGLLTPPALNNPRFVEKLVFTEPIGERVPKERFAGFFPSPTAALIQMRLRPELTDAERGRAIDLIQQTVASDRFVP